MVTRPRLSQRLSQGTQLALTLVSAPAGFGKTTLLTEWIADPSRNGQVAWLSLDERDSDPVTFWTYVIAALRTAAPGVGDAAMSLLHSPDSPTEAVVASLLNEVDALPDDVVLVLDDLHVVDSREVYDGIRALLDRLPPQLHVVIATRTDPPLALARLRARGELVEIRAGDLRFTADESKAFLTDVMGVAVTADDVAVLEDRTEGWIAALQLAGLSLQGRDDVAGFIAGFAGDDRFVVDYLVEEVLQRQGDDATEFLLQTSILDRLTGSLCDAVTARDGGRDIIEKLDRANLFLVSLDDQRAWYRYHHLFRDVLRARLMHERPADIPSLHRRASTWFEEHGHLFEAIHHALAADDDQRAATLMELAIPAVRVQRQDATLLGWHGALPADVVRARPALSVGFVGALMSAGKLDEADDLLAGAERWLEEMSASPTPKLQVDVVDDDAMRRLPSAVQMYRAAQAQLRGDGAATLQHAVRALELAPVDDHFGRAAAAGFLGIARWARGDLVAAHDAYTECMTGLQRAGHVADVLGCALALGDIRRAQGRLGDALRTYEGALQAASESGAGVAGLAAVRAELSDIHRERNDLDAAAAQLRRSLELASQAGLPHEHRRYVAAAQARAGDGDLVAALDLLDEASRVHVNDFFPAIRPIDALRARVQVRSGRLDESLDWARRRGLSVADELSYVSEFEHITFARLLLALSRAGRAATALEDGTRLLQRLGMAADQGGRQGSLIEILVLQSLAARLRGEVPTAVSLVGRAAALAAPEGYVRVFVDEGQPLAALVSQAAREAGPGSYLRHLSAAFEGRNRPARIQQGLIDPLSERELEVLRLLSTDLSGPDIARELVVSLNTVRTHTKNIYAKLGANSRRAAVRRGAELDLLSVRASG